MALPKIQTLKPVGGPTFGAAPKAPPLPRPPKPPVPSAPAVAAPKPTLPAPVTQGPAATTPPPPNPWQALEADPRWIAQAPAFAAQRNQAYIDFGWVPDAASSSGYRVAGASEQPYSVANMLAQRLREGSRNVGNRANASGFLFSGAHAQAQRDQQTAYEQGLAEAWADFLGRLSGIAGEENDLRTSLYEDYRDQPAPLAAQPEPVASPTEEIERRRNNDAATGALHQTTNLTALAQLYNQWKGKVDDYVLRAIDAKLKEARARKGAR